MSFVHFHSIWAVGHGIMLASASYVLIQAALFRGTPQIFYRLGFTGALLSYSIVVYKSLGVPQLSNPGAWLQRAFVDENVQYAVLALYWWISKPINLAILPFATFSLFHVLTFLRTNVIPKFVPPSQAPQPGQQRPAPTGLEAVSRKIQVLVKNNYDGAMRFVAFAELAILLRVTIGALTFTYSFIAPIFLAHFIRLRYHASPFSRHAVDTITARIDGIAGNQGGVVANTWGTAKRMIGTWGGGRMIPAQGAGAAGVGAGARGPAAQAQARRQQ